MYWSRHDHLEEPKGEAMKIESLGSTCYVTNDGKFAAGIAGDIVET